MTKTMMSRIPSQFSIPSWPAWIQMIVACFAGTVIGGYVAANVAISKSEETVRQRTAIQAIERFVALGGEIRRDGTKVTEAGTPVLKGLSFFAIDSKNQMRRAIFSGSLLPEVSELHFAPPGANKVGEGITDSEMLRVAQRNFPYVSYLDVSNCQVQDLTSLQKFSNLRVLNLVNNPLTYNEIQSLNLLNSVTELWIGWPDRSLDNDSLYRTSELRRALVRAMSEMKNLRSLHIYDIRLGESDRKQLGSIEIFTERMP